MDFDHLVHDLQRLDVNLYDFALFRDGDIRAHRFRPCSRSSDSYSVAKVFVLTALGFLWDEGKIGLHDLLPAYFKEELDHYGAAPAWHLVSVEDVIKHTIGFGEGFLDIDTEDVAAYPTDDYLQIVLTHPLTYRPGTYRQYSDASYYLLARLVEKVGKEPVDRLLNRRLLAPMGFQEVAWSLCPRNHPIGATGLYISAADMVKVGALYLQGGVYGGKRFLSQAWVDTVLAGEYEFASQNADGLYAKGGMYGQGLAFSRSGGYAAAWHAFEEDHEKSHRVVEYLKNLD